ncbi:hypothetical protein B5C34_13120 [Pacificimonas flava]|uniref:O-glycosylation ligase, exosortase A system-associated n=2 Tax=Pacificimonas TaxID=1960290 RepID=A0A219B861_9SPHN|nr:MULTISPECIES: DUF5935 domain-containing protein [Pacificimonas]MBZ6378390.1 O-antigen ligase family protein [Pacificimonas aurantium]OWV34306.1 hypothetical protein B5C34_13120 [Pacificimonas flava]
MRDLFLILILLGFIAMSFRYAYFMALGYLWVDFLQPQRLAYYVFTQLPVAMILGAGALVAFLFFDKEKRIRFSVLQGLVILLLVYQTMATFGWSPIESGAAKWDWVTKALIFSVFLPFILTTRVRIEAALAIMLFSTAAITMSAAAKTALGSSGYGTLALLVNNNTGIYEQSTLVTVTTAFVPLVWWFYKYNSFFKPSKLTFLIALGITVSFLIITVGTEARTGLVAMAVMAGIFWWRSSRKLLIAGLVAAVGIGSVPFLPESFVERMSTIQDPTADMSASTRLAMWEWTIDFVQDNPLGGGFNANRLSQIATTLVRKTGEPGFEDVTTTTVMEQGRAFHSSYFEVLGEFGYPGFLIWITTVILFYLQSRRIYSQNRKVWREMDEDDPDRSLFEWAMGFGQAVSIFVPTYMVGSLFVGIAFQPPFWHIMALTVSTAAMMTEKRADRIVAAQKEDEKQVRSRRRRPGGPATAAA